MRRTISPILLLLSVTTAGLLSAVGAPGASGIGAPASFHSQSDGSAQHVAAWLSRAPSTDPVVCSVDRTLAPDSVAEFEKISAKISALYARIHAEVRAVSAEGIEQPADTLTMSVLPNQPDGARARQQATVTASYQATLQEIEAHRKELARYTDALKTEPAIAGFASRIQQTIILTQFGRNAYQLGEQLKAAGEGAALVLQQRLSDTIEH